MLGPKLGCFSHCIQIHLVSVSGGFYAIPNSENVCLRGLHFV